MAQEYTYLNATGVIHYNMTNDYMFRYILQKNQKVDVFDFYYKKYIKNS